MIHIILMLSGFIAAGQNIELDSMRTVLDGMNNDTARVNILIEMADECRYNFPEDVKLFNDQALQLAQASDYSLGEGLASKGLGKYHYDIGQYDSAMYYYNRAEMIFRGMDDKKELSNVMADYCYVCVAQGEYNKALEAGLSSLQLAGEIGDQEELQRASAFLGFTYHSAGNKDEALQYLSNAVDIARERGDIEGTATILRDIAIVYDDDK